MTIRGFSMPGLARTWSSRPWAWIALALLLTLAAVPPVTRLGIDTDLIRLLPDSSRASTATRELDGVVGASSYFAVILEGAEPAALRRAADELAARVRELPGVASVEYRNPVDFIARYRYLLIPSYYLDRLEEEVLDWEAEVNPFVDDLASSRADEAYGRLEDRKEIESRLSSYGDLPRYHSSRDGRLVGLFVRPERGVTSLAETRALYARLDELAVAARGPAVTWSGVSGSMRNKIDEYEVITGDLARAGTIAATLISITLLLATHSITATLVSVGALLLGQLWGFALVPPLVGDLNTITAFLLVVVFGMGIDFAIHLVARFRIELEHSETSAALLETYTTTGRAVTASALSTALALAVLRASDFRGFSEFGLVGSVALLSIWLAMYVVLPPLLVLTARAGLLSPGGGTTGRVARRLLPSPALALPGLLLAGVAMVVAVTGLSFDYDFSNLRASADLPDSLEAKEKQRLVYTTTRSPGAVYVAPDLATLDAALAVFDSARRDSETLGRLASLRDLSPTAEEERERRARIEGLEESLSGVWVRRIEDPDRRRWAEDLVGWSPPPRAPAPEEVPEELAAGFYAADGSLRPLLAVYPAVERSNGLNAMAFTEELYALPLPEGLRGPVGETPVFAEILWLVTGEGPWLVLATAAGILAILLLYQRSLPQALWIMLPLAAGMAATLGAMAVLGLRLNFFNIVAIPALLGLGVDDGVHYYRRWRETGGDTAATHAELLRPLTVTSATTIMGYAGMAFAHHQGLQSIGLVACLGLSLIWLASVLLLPSALRRWHPLPAAARTP